MAYAALSAFLTPSEPTAEDFARQYAQRWQGMTPDQLERELLPIFHKLQRACDALKAANLLHVITDDSDAA